MSPEDLHIGMGVAYEAYPGAPREDGIVTEIRPGGAMVRYSVNGPAKLTPFDRLTALIPTAACDCGRIAGAHWPGCATELGLKISKAGWGQ